MEKLLLVRGIQIRARWDTITWLKLKRPTVSNVRSTSNLYIAGGSGNDTMILTKCLAVSYQVKYIVCNPENLLLDIYSREMKCMLKSKTTPP